MTLCVEGRKPVLANAEAWKMCISSFGRLDRWTILAALAMPDHLHVLASPHERDASVGEFLKWFKRWFNEDYRKLGGPFPNWKWQESGFDRLLRSDESTYQKWLYIQNNPVRGGLVTDPDDWPYQLTHTNGL